MSTTKNPNLPTDFNGRHLIVDASTYNRRNLTSTDVVFSLFEALARNLDMTLVIPPIVCRYPFASDELSKFCEDIEAELSRKSIDGADKVDLNTIHIMRSQLRKRQMEDSGVTGISVWAESHCAIHTWDEDNYFSFDAYSCTDYRLKDALRLLLSNFDIEFMNCVNVMRFQRSAPRISHFQVNSNWDVIVNGKKAGELDSVDFETIPTLLGP